MKELETLVDELKEHILSKEVALMNSPLFNSYIDSQLINRHKEIMLFEESTRHVETNPLHKKEIIQNFLKGAIEIKERIAEIKHR